jgi:urea transport system ATP-binding protein
MLTTRDLTLHYSGSQILYGISMEATRGTVTCVMGTNGVGKTSLFKAISGTHPRSGGTLALDGQELPVLPPHAMAHHGVGYVPQGRMIFPLLTVQENLETGLACLPRSERVVADAIFELFPVLKEMKNRRGGDLSGGQQQQLAIGRALVTKPKLLLLDEPTEGIQPNIIQQIGRVITYLRDQGEMAIVLVEQYFDFAWKRGDHFYVLDRGQVAFDKPKSDLTKDELAQVFTV